MADTDDVDTDNINGSECEMCGAKPGQPCEDWC